MHKFVHRRGPPSPAPISGWGPGLWGGGDSERLAGQSTPIRAQSGLGWLGGGGDTGDWSTGPTPDWWGWGGRGLIGGMGHWPAGPVPDQSEGLIGVELAERSGHWLIRRVGAHQGLGQLGEGLQEVSRPAPVNLATVGITGTGPVVLAFWWLAGFLYMQMRSHRGRNSYESPF